MSQMAGRPVRVSILICLAALICTPAHHPAWAEPNESSVTAFRALVADYSETSGGCSPALSPDGRALAYMSSEGAVYILRDIDLQTDRAAEPWQLISPPENSDRFVPRLFDMRRARNIDWSHDGSQLAFAYPDGRICVADNIDYQSRKARIRTLVARSAQWSRYGHVLVYGSPRWSPDDQRIAFVRQENGAATSVMVVEEASGAISTPAHDAVPDASVWEQPWSRDGRRIAYGMRDPATRKQYVAVITVRGKAESRFPCGARPSPCWSPVSDTLAFQVESDKSLRLSDNLQVINTSCAIGSVGTGKTHARVRRLSVPSFPTSDQDHKAAVDGIARLWQQLCGRSKGKSGSTSVPRSVQPTPSANEVENLLCRQCAEGAGGKIKRLVDMLMVAGTHSTSRSSGAKRSVMGSVISAVSLPDADRSQFIRRLSDSLYAATPPEWFAAFESDSHPVWSPDGKRIAFIRSRHRSGKQRLIVRDVNSGKEREVYTAPELQCVGWSKDANLIVLQSRRTMAMRHDGDGHETASGTDRITTSGYPEVWLVQLDDIRSGCPRWSADRAIVLGTRPIRVSATSSGRRGTKSSVMYLAPMRAGLQAGAAYRFHVCYLDQDGRETPPPGEIVWTATPNLGAIDQNGLFTAKGQPGVYHGAVEARCGTLKAVGTIEILSPVRQDGYLLDKVVGGFVPGYIKRPTRMVVDSDGLRYVADGGASRIQIFDPSGKLVDFWGSFGSGDGQFSEPSGLVFDKDGNLFVSDGNNTRIQKFSHSGKFLMKWGEYGHGDGQFEYPMDLTIDRDGFIYVLDHFGCRVQKFTADGKFVTKWGSPGKANGQFTIPRGIAASDSGYIYVVDFGNNRVQKFDTTGQYISQWGSYGSRSGQFSFAMDLTIDGNGNVYVLDSGGQRVEVFDPVGNLLSTCCVANSSTGLQEAPFCVALDEYGGLLVADNRNEVLQLGDGGTSVEHIGHTYVQSGDFEEPQGTVMSPDGCLFVCDDKKDIIQKFSPSGEYLGKSRAEWMDRIVLMPDGSYWGIWIGGWSITKISTSGAVIGEIRLPRLSDGTTPKARDMALGADGNLYVIFSKDNRILKLSTSGQVLDQWKTNSETQAIAVDPSGNLHLACLDATIRTLDSSGKQLSACAPVLDKPDRAVRICTMAVDRDGYVYAIDECAKQLIKVSPDGQVLSRVARGEMVRGAISVDDAGRVYVADGYSGCLRIYAPAKK